MTAESRPPASRPAVGCLSRPCEVGIAWRGHHGRPGRLGCRLPRPAASVPLDGLLQNARLRRLGGAVEGRG